MNHYRLLSLVFVFLVLCSCSDDPANPVPVVEPDLGHGAIAITCEPDSCAGPWSLVGPDSSLSGISDATLVDMNPGLYAITWGSVPGWHDPDPATFSLEVFADSTTTFVGTYTFIPVELEPGVIAITCEPDSCAGPWNLVGPDSTLTGISDATLTGMTPGLYEITWGSVPGWHDPDPAIFSLEVAADSTTTFVGTYSFIPVELEHGVIAINCEPDSCAGPWSLVGPDSTLTGISDVTLTEMKPGLYTITWGSVPGWDDPDPATFSLEVVADSTTTFVGIYSFIPIELEQGIIAINCDPDNCPGPWSLVGPDSILIGISDVTLVDMTPGLYAITWGSVPGWHDPDPATFSLEVVADSTTTFVGAYSVVQVVTEVAAFPRLKATAPGEQTQFKTFVTDQFGNEVFDVPAAWHSSDTQVATIDSSGTATGVAPGRVEIMASVGEVSSTSVNLVVAENWFGTGLCDETDLPCTTFNPRISLSEEFSNYFYVTVDVDGDGTTDCIVDGAYYYGNNIDAHTSVTPVGGAWVAVNTAYSAIADSILANDSSWATPFHWEDFTTWTDRFVLGTSIDENLEWVQEKATVDYFLKDSDGGRSSFGVPVESAPYFVAIRVGEPPAVTYGWIEIWGGNIYGCSGVGVPSP